MIVATEQAAATMTIAATAFVDSLTPEQRQRATFPFEGRSGLRWHFIPTEGFPRNGLLIKDMTEAQRAAAYDFLKTGLSARGYQTYTAIIQLESVLREIEQGRAQARDPELYRFSIFGTPGERGTWGWRVEGHHVSLHYTSSTARSWPARRPSAAPTRPKCRTGPRRARAYLGSDEDAGRALLTALDAIAAGTAVVAAPRRTTS